MVVSLRALAQAIDAVAQEEAWPWSVDDEVDNDDEGNEDEEAVRPLGPGMALLREAGDLLEQAAGAGIIEGSGWAPGVQLGDQEHSGEARRLIAEKEPMGTVDSINGQLGLPDRVQLAMRLWAGEAATGEAGAPRLLVFSSRWEQSDRSESAEEIASQCQQTARREAE